MNRALIAKTMRDHTPLFALAFAGTVIIPLLVIFAFSSMPIDMLTQWLKLPWIRNLLRMLMGADPTDMLNRTSFAAFAFVHPVVLSVVWAYVLVISTKVLAGEVDHGSADLLLSLPISRWGVYVSVSVVVFGCGPGLAIAPWLGACITEVFDDSSESLMRNQLLLVSVNKLAAYWAVAGAGMAISACFSRRGVAVGVLFTGLLVSFLLNVLGVLWAPAERVAFLSLLYYFRPLVIVREGHLDAGHIGVLLAVGAISWIIGGIVFARRDIRTT
jgi:ABC-type transport system involved in multi-copper enzyme maturation permease subunit